MAINKAEHGRLAFGGLHHILHWSLSDVFRCHSSSKNKKTVIGTMNQKAGCAGSILNLLQMEEFNHQVEITTEYSKRNAPKYYRPF